MRISDRIDSQQILGVSLTLIMLLSMGSIGFIGGVGTVGAQDATGGTFDEVFDTSQNVSGELNVDTGTVSLVGPDADSDGDVNVVAESDGQIEVSSPGDDGEFAGVAISPERINAVSMPDSTADPATPANFLNDIPNEFAVASSVNDAYPAIFIEYAPQSEFSQIEGSNGITDVNATANGEHDFIVIANSSDVAAITDTTAKDISGNGIVALSVDNDDVSGGNLNVSNASQATVLVTGSNFGSVARDLTGPEVTDLQNSNIDDIRFTAGVFGDDSGATISQVLLADDIASTNFDAGPNNNGETIHHEQITLNGETSFASIAAAEAVASSGDRIEVAEGEYTTGSSGLEPSALDIETDQLVISGANSAPGADRVNSVGDLTGLESELRVDIDANDTRDFTLENFAVTHSGSGPAISVLNEADNNDEPRNPRLDAVVVRASSTDADGVAFGTRSGSDNITLTDSAIFQTADPDDVDNGQTGVVFQEVNGPVVSSNNLIVGFERQVVDDTSLGVSLADFFANNRFGEDDPDDLAHAAVVVDKAGATPGSLTSVSTIFGSINAADDAAEDGEVIDVFDATYREDFSNSIDTNTTAVVGDDAVDVADTSGSDTVVLNSSGGDVRVESLTLINDTGLSDSGAAAGNITIDDVVVEEGTGAITLTNTADDANVVVGNVTAERYNGTGQFLTIGPRDLGQVSVADSQIDLDDTRDASVGGVVINTTNATVGGVSVTNTTVDATAVDATDTPTGITVDVDGVNGDVDISTNNVINASDGLGIAYTTASGASADGIGDEGELLVENNRVSGGSGLTAMRLQPVQDGDGRTTGSVDGNVLIGTGVGDGTGLVTRGTQGSDLKDLILEDADSNPVKSNTISGFETLINSELSRPSTFDVSAAYGDSLGTHVVPDEIDAGGSVEESPIQGNIFGSIEDANDNLDPQNNNNTVDLRITDTDLSIDSLHGNPVPTDYVHATGDEVRFDTNLNNVNVEGPGAGTDAPVVQNVNFVIPDGNDNLANHDIRDLRLDGTNGDAAIAVESTSNSQSTFENLTVTTTATGVDVNSQDDDVTVVEIRDSTFDVDGDGIVLADSPDDRDGFVIEDVTLAGDNLTEASDTGLNLSNVDTPGKEELPTELEVRGLDVFNFETQLELSEELVTNFPALDAQAVYENDSAVASLDSGEVVFKDNNFTQAAFVNESFEADISRLEADIVSEIDDADAVVFADTGEPASQERLADNQTIYGSITEADVTGVDTTSFDGVTLQAVTSAGSPVGSEDDVRVGVFDDAGNFLGNVTISGDQDAVVDVNTSTAIIDVKAASQNLNEPERLYAENVELGAGDTNEATELLVRGPQAGVAATDSARGDEAFILGTVGDTTGDDAAITIDGFTTVAPHEYTVIQFETDISRFDSDLGGFEDGDEFVINQEIENADISDSPVDGDASRFDFDTIAPPTEEAVATFNDNRTISVNNTAFSADVTEDRFIVTEPDDIEIARNNPAPDEIKTSAVGIRVSNVTSATVANSFVGNHTAVDTTGDSVVTSEDHTVDIIDSTLAAGPVDVSTEEADDSPTNTLLFDDIAGFDVNDAANPVGVNAEASLVTVTDSAVDGHTGDGVLLTGDTRASGATVVLDDSAVTNSGARGVAADGTLTDLTVDNTTVADSGSTGVDVNGDNATITEATIQDNNGDGILLSNTLTGAAITQTTIANNTAPGATASGLRLTEFVDAPNVTVRANAFENNDFGIVVEEGDTGTETLDATLNYFGDRNGPAAAGGDSVNENVVYDPFLSEDRTGTSPAAIESTTGFAHDVIVPATDGERTFVAVGFPAQLEGVGLSGDATVDDYIDPSYDGNVYAFFQSNNSFSPVSGDRKIEAFDALVVENARTEDRDRVVSLEYEDNRGPTALPDNRLTYDTGLNFVAPQQAGQVDEVLFPGGDTDAIVQPFPAGENLYGAESADQVRDQFVTVDGAQEVSTNFRSGAGDATVHPHVGYFAVVNENTNEGLTVVESIPVPDSPTADEIANRTDANSDVVATNAETGETFESLTAALSEVNEFETLVLERGTLAPDRDELTLTQDNIRLVGQGESQTEIAADLVLNGSSIQIDAVDVVTNSPTGKITVTGPGASLNAVTAEDGIEIQAERTSVTGGSVGNLTIDDGVTSATVTDTDVTNTLDINSDSPEVSISNTTADNVSTQPDNTLTDVSTRTVEVGNADDLDAAAEGNEVNGAPVGSQTTVVVNSSINTTSDSVAITQDGLTITKDDSSRVVSADPGTDVFDVAADNVAIAEVTTEADNATAIDLAALNNGEDVTIENATLDLTAGSGADVDVGINATGATDIGTATIEDNTFQADDAGAERFVSDADDQLDVAAIQDENTFPENVVLVEGNSDFALTPTIQGGVTVADNVGAADTVSVSDGTFEESVTVDVEGLTLEGAEGGDENPEIESFKPQGADDPSEPAILVNADNVTINSIDAVEGIAPRNNQDVIEIADGVSGTTLANLAVESPEFAGSAGSTGEPVIGVPSGEAISDITIRNVTADRSIGLVANDSAEIVLDNVTATKTDKGEAVFITGPSFGPADVDLTIESLTPQENEEETGGDDLLLFGSDATVSGVDGDATVLANEIFDQNPNVDQVTIDEEQITRD